LATQQKTN